MTGPLEDTAARRALVVGSDRAAGLQVFGDHAEDVLATTYGDLDADLAEALPTGLGDLGLVAVAAGVGMGQVLDRLLVQLEADGAPVLAVEVPGSPAASGELRELLLRDGGPAVLGVRRFRDRPCLLLGPAGRAPARDRGWVVDSLLAAAVAAPDARTAVLGRTADDFEVSAAHARVRGLEEELQGVRDELDAARARLRRARSGGPARGAGRPARPAGGARSPRGVLLAASGVLGARSRRGRAVTLASLGLAAALVALVPVVLGAVAAEVVGALVGLGVALAVLLVCGLLALQLLLQRRLAGSVSSLASDVRRVEDRSLRTARASMRAERVSRRTVASVQRGHRAQAGLTKDLRTAVQEGGEVVRQQVQATLNVFDLAPPRAGVPPLGGWAASPDLMVELLDRLVVDRPRTVVETGSGLSTLFFALAAERHGLDTRIVALEHSAHFAAQTRRLLERHGVADRAEVRFAPLTRTRLEEHATIWYDESALADLSEIGLLLVDGPPKSTGPSARYPAVPLLRDRLAARCAIVIDDTARKGDRQVAERWAGELPDFAFAELPLEKGAVVLHRG